MNLGMSKNFGTVNLTYVSLRDRIYRVVFLNLFVSIADSIPCAHAGGLYSCLSTQGRQEHWMRPARLPHG